MPIRVTTRPAHNHAGEGANYNAAGRSTSRRPRGAAGRMTEGEKHAIFRDLVMGRRVGDLAKEHRCTRETIRRYRNALSIAGLLRRFSNEAEMDVALRAFVHHLGLNSRKSAAAAAANLPPEMFRPTPTTIEYPQPARNPSITPAGYIASDDAMPPDERRRILAKLARMTATPAASVVQAVKTLEEIDTANRPQESFAPPPPLTDEQAASRLAQLMDVVGPAIIVRALRLMGVTVDEAAFSSPDTNPLRSPSPVPEPAPSDEGAT